MSRATGKVFLKPGDSDSTNAKIHYIRKDLYDSLVNRFEEVNIFSSKMKIENDQLKARLKLLSRYHGGDGSVTREQVFEALADTGGK